MDTTRSPVSGPSRLAVLFAAVSAASWAAKSVAIGIAGGLGLSPAEGPFFFLGLASNVAAVACLLLAAAPARSRGVRILMALGALPLVFLVGAVTRTAVWLVEPDDPGWVWSELNLWVIAVALLCLSVVVRRRVRRAGPAAHLHGDSPVGAGRTTTVGPGPIGAVPGGGRRRAT